MFEISPFAAARCPRLIVKVGSSLLVTPDGEVRRDWLGGLAADIAAAVRSGQQVAIVSSGAIALGARRLKLTKGGRASLGRVHPGLRGAPFAARP